LSLLSYEVTAAEKDQFVDPRLAAVLKTAITYTPFGLYKSLNTIQTLAQHLILVLISMEVRSVSDKVVQI